MSYSRRRCPVLYCILSEKDERGAVAQPRARKSDDFRAIRQRYEPFTDPAYLAHIRSLRSASQGSFPSRTDIVRKFLLFSPLPIRLIPHRGRSSPRGSGYRSAPPHMGADHNRRVVLPAGAVFGQLRERSFPAQDETAWKFRPSARFRPPLSATGGDRLRAPPIPPLLNEGYVVLCLSFAPCAGGERIRRRPHTVLCNSRFQSF